VLDNRREVVRCLVTYTDWWQPSTTSILQVGAARRSKEITEGLHPGLIETLEERTELCRRVFTLAERDRKILFLWYVKQLHVDDVADSVGLSRRQCFRRRTAALESIVKLGEPNEAA
jgi:DNA-directed RNA polymerase specialized sigma subunit